MVVVKTKIAKTVTNIFKLSPTHLVSNIRQQPRCFLFEVTLVHMINILEVLQGLTRFYKDFYILATRFYSLKLNYECQVLPRCILVHPLNRLAYVFSAVSQSPTGQYRLVQIIKSREIFKTVSKGISLVPSALTELLPFYK